MVNKFEDSNLTLRRIVECLGQIGLDLVPCDLPDDTFLPGICVAGGQLNFDPIKLKYPGDLLHEAGHLAILTAEQRQNAGNDFAGDGGNEMGAIAWSYAACIHLDLPLDVLFHENGYKGDAAWLADTFSNGTYIGLPMLEWKRIATAHGQNAYPRMIQWLCP